MSSPAVTIDMDDTLETVRNLFAEMKFHHLLVTSHGQLRGVLSDRDLLKSISHRVGTVAATKSDLDTLLKRAHQIMSREPVVVTVEASIREAACLLTANRVSCLPVVDSDQRPLGIVSWRDIMADLCSGGVEGGADSCAIFSS